MAARLRAFADIVVFLFADRPVEAQILRNDRAIGFVADHDKALFGAHDMQSFGAVGGDVPLFASLKQPVPERAAQIGGHGDFVAQLTRERDAIGTHREAAEFAVFPLHKAKAVFRHIHAAQLFQEVAGIGADDGNLRVLLGDVDGPDFPVPPFGLQPLFHVRMDAIRAAGGGVAKERVLIDAGNDAIVRQEPVFRTHQPVAAFARFQRAHHVGVHHVEEPARIGAFDDDLAEGRGV